MSSALLKYDKEFIYCWEMVGGRCITALVLRRKNCTGQLVTRPILGTPVTHVGIILGKSLTGFEEYFVCSFTPEGVEIQVHGELSFLSQDCNIDQDLVLARLEHFFKSKPIDYCLGSHNCYWFAFKIVKGADSFAKFRNGLFILILIILLVCILDAKND